MADEIDGADGDGTEQGEMQRFRTMLEVEPGAAGRLLEQLQARASEALTVA
jgi:hypothetical protein